MYREPFPQLLLSFPFRWFAFFNRNVSAGRNIPYWYRPHTSKTRLPILFIHGTGVGLHPYLGFFLELLGKEDPEDAGQTGIIILELLPISGRITTSFPLRKSLRTQILDIVESHGWSKFVLAMHSFGTFVGSQLLHDPDIAPRIGPMLFVDPVVFLLHLPDVARNFLARLPSGTMEHVIWYFSGKDPLVRHTLQRRLFWMENVLWKEELRNRDVTVALGGKDAVVDSPTVRKYLLGSREWGGNESWTGNGLDVVWFEGFNHAEMFDWKTSYRMLAEILREYSVNGKRQHDILGI
jgi:pimeloyl-ACP methyl ester carboxylesterase